MKSPKSDIIAYFSENPSRSGFKIRSGWFLCRPTWKEEGKPPLEGFNPGFLYTV